jgi:N utilization substance protein B
VISKLSELDSHLVDQADHWRLERMAAVDRNILRLALYELMFEGDTPPAVVIDEAVEIAKRFGSERSSQFVNGVLDGYLHRGEAAGES